jgi:hypothetical protein
MLNFSANNDGKKELFWTTPSDADLIWELQEMEMCRKCGETEEAQRLLNIVMQAMISRDRDERVRRSLVCVCNN